MGKLLFRQLLVLVVLLYICIFAFLLGNCNNYFVNRSFLIISCEISML